MSITAHDTDLKVTTSNRQILSIALPIILAMLVPQINFLTNNIFLGGLGETELGIAGITGVFYLIFALIGSGLNNGLLALIARRAGEGRPREIGKLSGQAIWISMFFATACILVIYFVAPFALHATLKSSEVEKTAIQFLKIRAWGIPFLYLFLLGNAFLVGSNNSRYLKYAFIIESGLNIILDYTLIYGHWGFPKLGFNGAAVASVIAEIVALAIVLLIIVKKKFHTRFSLFHHLKFNKIIAGLVFRQSSPLVMQFLLSIIGWLIFFIMIENTGKHNLAISNTMRNIFGIFGIFCWGFASTSNAMVSNIIGQGKKDEVLYLIKKIMWLSVAFTVSLCLLLNLIPGYFLSIFGQNEIFIADAIPVIRMVSIAILFMSVATVWLNAVTGTANTSINLLIEVIAIALYIIYMWFGIRVWQFSLVWAWSVELLYWGVTFLLSWLYMRSGKWKKKVI
jgi:putative MATE family efflux protein